MKTIRTTPLYAAQHIYAVNIPGCTAPGKVFVGQRKDPFAVNLGVVFDLLNVPGAADFTPAEARVPARQLEEGTAGEDDLADCNVTTLALEVPTSCLLASGANDPCDRRLDDGEPASGVAPQQRAQERPPDLGADRRRVDAGVASRHAARQRARHRPARQGQVHNSKPKDDGQFADLRDQSDLAALVEIALATPGIAPTNFPRTDLVTTFLTASSASTSPRRSRPRRRRASLPRCCASTTAIPPDRRSVAETASACSADCSALRRRTSPAIRTGAGRATTSSTSR
jgi:hypothetical protein